MIGGERRGGRLGRTPARPHGPARAAPNPNGVRTPAKPNPPNFRDPGLARG